MSNEARRPTPSLAAGPDVTTLEVQLRVNKILIDKMEALANINPIKPATEWGKGYAACTLDVACGAKVVLEEVRALPPPAAPLEAAPDRDEEGEAHARPIPEAARIKLEEAQSYFQKAGTVGMALPMMHQLKVWDCIVMAKSFLGEAPGEKGTEEEV